MSRKHGVVNREISKVEVTSETLSDRGGLSLFVKYLGSIEVLSLLLERFGHLRRSSKGSAIDEIFKQVLCFFLDGTSFSMNQFDRLRQDAGYAGVLEVEQRELISSHGAKRFFKSFPTICSSMFRPVLRRLFIWRLCLENPKVINLTVDTEVFNNDDAKQREGVQPTYKKVKGFQPLHVIWEGRIVDAIFRGGKKNGNYGNVVATTLKDIVNLIRKEYSEEVAIIVRLDAGFFDQKLFKACDELGIGFICTGKMYPDVKERVADIADEEWKRYANERQVWEYAEWQYKAESWKTPYRAFYTRPVYEEDGQGIIAFARPDNMIVTNIGHTPEVVEHCTPAEKRKLKNPKTIIHSHHQRGADELPHRGLKDFGTEKFPFKRFAPNAAFYYCMVIAFFLFECFKRDVLADALPKMVTSYPTTIRRNVLDFAAKIVRTAGQVVLKITRHTMDTLHFQTLWQKALTAPAHPL